MEMVCRFPSSLGGETGNCTRRLFLHQTPYTDLRHVFPIVLLSRICRLTQFVGSAMASKSFGIVGKLNEPLDIPQSAQEVPETQEDGNNNDNDSEFGGQKGAL